MNSPLDDDDDDDKEEEEELILPGDPALLRRHPLQPDLPWQDRVAIMLCDSKGE
jgi:hypothetical protein